MEVYSARVVNVVFWGIDGEFHSVVVLFLWVGDVVNCGALYALWWVHVYHFSGCYCVMCG